MEVNNKDNFKMDVINFARSVTPMPIEVRQGTTDDKYVKWGDNNLYPHFLLEIFNEVSLHNGIIKSKVNHVLGKGLVVKSTQEKATFQLNGVDNLEEIIQKIAFDFVLFNFFIIEVQYNAFGKAISYNHLPAHHIRANEPRTKFWYSRDWLGKKNLLTYDRWTKGDNTDEIIRSKIFMYSGYSPSVNNVYPIAQYEPAKVEMYTEIICKEFNKNNIEDGFSATAIISFNKGIPTAEQARELERKFDANFKGSNGKRYMLNYNEAGSKDNVQVDQLGAIDYAAALSEIRVLNETAILTVHQGSKQLFGLPTPGSLGAKNEIEEAFQTFKSVYVTNARNVIESGLNKLLMDNGYPEIEFQDQGSFYVPVLSDATREKVLTVNELRAIDGKDALPDGDKLLTATAAPVFSLATPSTSPAKFTNTDSTDYSKGRKLTIEDFELVKELGTAKSNYTIVTKSDFHVHSRADMILFDDQKDIENYLISNEEANSGKTLAEIKADIVKQLGIKVTTSDLSEQIKALTDSKLLNSEINDDGTVNKLPEPSKKADKADAKSNKIQVMYEYKVKPGKGEPIIDTSRDFCIKLIENDRLYTREDIQSMSSIFGYSVFDHCGGWYFNAKTQKSEDQCRHFWNMVRVSRINND